MSDLYIQKSDLRLSLSKNKLIVRNVDSEIIKEISLNKIDNIIIFGDSQLTTQLQKKTTTIKYSCKFLFKSWAIFWKLSQL
ncbi:CRISPR-associated endonuclease Cas1 [Streptococcus uberis]|nr:CRISPR-associated endonuclease Cas1 [Streptococcus uberis]MCK1199211.1 CRISPR-associated endonuclease Cas1 [Streptococcus uberis]